MKLFFNISLAASFAFSLIGWVVAASPTLKVIDLSNDVKLEMILIPKGKFFMGSPDTEKGRGANELIHEVTISKSFFMGKFEVTQEQWQVVLGENPSEIKGIKLPVTNVSWNDSLRFIKKLNEITKRSFRLPTEAEWEYACRGNTKTAYSFDAELLPSQANFFGSDLAKPVPVGSYKPNALGLYDMHGNVWEWCNDWFAAYSKNPAIDPQGPVNGEYRVLRGGSFVNRELSIRSAVRFLDTASYSFEFRGFRLALTE